MMSKDLEKYTSELKKRNLLPKKFEFSQFNNWHLVSAFSFGDTLAISEQVTMGIDLNFEIAYAKALTEYQERNLLKGIQHFSFDLFEKSDGVAAFPTSMANSSQRVRQNAFNEIVERFLWANWWDDLSVKFDLLDATDWPHLRELKVKFKLEKITNIYIKHKPLAKNVEPVDLCILLAKNVNGGYITGGAAGNKQQDVETFNRAYGELLRHLIVVEAFSAKSSTPQSFYEKRLWGFASGEWSDIVDKRLNINGQIIIDLPNLVSDELIPHPNDDIVLIHRCLFKGQPPFVGGDLQRLCL